MAKHELIGAKITGVRQMSDTEQTNLYGYPAGAINGAPTVFHLRLEDGEEVGLIAMQDPEGNGPGTFIMLDRQGGTYYAEHWARTQGA